MSQYELIENNRERLTEIYGSSSKTLELQKNRYKKLIDKFEENYSTQPTALFSSPGRTEICGNHTDHNNGKVMAASINLDTIAAVAKCKQKISIRSKGYDVLFEVNLNSLEKNDEEEGTTTALIRGICAQFRSLGYKIGGFQAYFSSLVGVGSGLSSSASVEVLIGTILNYLYNDGNIADVTIAQIGQYAENQYFGKPCGLMDQLSISVGGVLEIDFKNNNSPEIDESRFDKEKAGFDIVIVDTGGNHADLTEDYASIPEEMKTVAGEFGKELCRELKLKELLSKIRILREKISDRALLRCLHFLNENIRVDELAEAINKNDYNRFLDIIRESGNSSFKYLQNCYTTKAPDDQGISLALALTDNFINNNNCRGACRVHGGGFAGTIQSFIEEKYTDKYIAYIEKIFGRNSATKINIRKYGSIKVV